ncbi:MAG: FKBP-type peptidyl-prolyl cis-trans isomerase [Spirochaetaceae bacterium]|jgi:FKBP-type peptidyl-prolyl cis-trans isomerase FkpA|nr:FKBP-type peptidyl-prolyl cis-trans isomerase [Spirochaetaceae bacterium]
MHKRIIFVAALLPLLVGVALAEGKVDTRAGPKPDVSYALGVVFGYDLKDTGLVIDYGHFAEGLRMSMEDGDTGLTLEEAMEIVQGAFLELREAEMAKNLERGKEFLRQNAERDGIRVTESGLQYAVVQEGGGERPSGSDTVRVHYEGRLIDGTVFDSSRENGSPLEFPLDAVIPGWTEGLALMTVGSRYQLFLPSELGYGEWGAGDIIPPNSALIFDVELLEIVRGDEAVADVPIGEDSVGESLLTGEETEETAAE